jgi:hypothetical protein
MRSRAAPAAAGSTYFSDSDFFCINGLDGKLSPQEEQRSP